MTKNDVFEIKICNILLNSILFKITEHNGIKENKLVILLKFLAKVKFSWEIIRVSLDMVNPALDDPEHCFII